MTNDQLLIEGGRKIFFKYATTRSHMYQSAYARNEGLAQSSNLTEGRQWVG